MSPGESSSSSDTREANPEDQPLGPAWQPLTPRGVAAFASARIGRLLLAQLVVASLMAAAVIWFLAAAWFPVIRQAIRQLPATGQIENQRLSSPHSSTTPLAENQFLSFVLDASGLGAASRAADLRIEFRLDSVVVCSLFGCLARNYPKDASVQFNRPELESWWAAWQLTLYITAGLGTLVWLFVSWLALGTLYWPVARVFAFFKDRDLTLFGSWKLTSAALLPGALLVAVGLVLYGLGMIDLMRFLLLWALHLVLGWVYLFVSPLCLPRAAGALQAKQNPFGASKPASANPFSQDR